MLLVDVTGVVVLVMCTVMKVPQIWKVVQAGTTQGISLQSLLMECWWSVNTHDNSLLIKFSKTIAFDLISQ